MPAVLLALAAAALFALGTVLQEKVAATAPDEEALRAGFLLRLARQPRWLAGIAVDAGGFVCQAAALGLGRLVVVQPLLASSVVFALPLGVRISNQRVGARELLSAIAVTVGLGAFLVVSDPSGGREDATTTAWIVSGAVIAAVCGVLVVWGAHRKPALKATLFGTAAGMLFALSAALTKSTVERLDDGVLAVLGSWQLYALIVVGYVSMNLSQTSLQTGDLAPAVATQMAVDPLVSVVLGTLAFDETIHDTAAGLAGSLVALVVMLAGLVVLAAAEQGGQADSAPAASSANRSVV